VITDSEPLAGVKLMDPLNVVTLIAVDVVAYKTALFAADAPHAVDTLGR